MEVARFVWWVAGVALLLSFIDMVSRAFAGTRWIRRATRERVVLGVLELATIAVWVLLRGRWRFLESHDTAVALAGAVLALTGALFAAWAKSRLGALFSPQLGVQEGHRLVTDGPYAVVRHPVYLGIIDFIAGSALFWNDVGLLLVAALFAIFFTAQIRIEEHFFAAHFGEQWKEYRSRTPALFPSIRPRRPE